MSSFMPVVETQLLLDESNGAVFFGLEQIYDALNEGIVDMAADGKWTTASVDVVLPAGTDLYTLPPTFLIPQHVLMGGLKYFFTSHAQLEEKGRQWKTATPAQPTEFVLWDVNRLRLWPVPDINYYAQIWGVSYPDKSSGLASPGVNDHGLVFPLSEITHKDQRIDLPPLLQEALIYRAVSELLEHTHPLLADEYDKRAESYTQAFRVQFRKRQSHSINILRPATRFTLAQSGDVRAGQRQGASGSVARVVWNGATKTWDENTSTWNLQ